MFSPYYAFARRRGRDDPANHVALNVALYGEGGKRWALTERSRAALRVSTRELLIGPSALSWDAGGLTISIDEIGVPVPRRIRGHVRVRPAALVAERFAIDHDGRHIWQPIAPLGRVEVELQQPRLSWSGSGYFDHNAGATSLEAAFHRWDWSRTVGGPTTTVHYDVSPRTGEDLSLAVEIDAEGRVSRPEAPPRALMSKSLWRIARGTRCDLGRIPRVVETLEDTPFYARSVVDSHHLGQPVRSMHESLDLDRFAMPIVQAMLPFRMPRRAR